MPTTEIPAIVMSGNSNFMTRRLNEIKKDYTGNTFRWTGLVNVKMNFTQEVESLAADNQPAFKQWKKVARGNGTVEFIGMKTSEYQNLLSVAASGKGVRFGSSNTPVVNFGMSFDEQVSDGSRNKFVIFNCNLTDLPPIETKTKAEGDNARRSTVLKVSAEIVMIDLANGEQEDTIYTILNSVENKAEFDLYEDNFVFPTE